MAWLKFKDSDVNPTVDVDVFCSESDLAMIQSIVDDVGVEVVLNKVFGFDNTKHYSKVDGAWYEAIDVEHINRQGKRVKCVRYSGFERTDKAWLKGAMASDMVKTMVKDPFMLKELEGLK
jgi:hypothetical protein